MFEYVTTFADSVFYDASAWTMAAAYGMPFAPAPTAKAGAELKEVTLPSHACPQGEAYAYLIDWRDYYAPKLLFELQKAGVHVEALHQPFSSQTQEGKVDFGRGTLMIPMGFQSLSKAEVMQQLKTLAQKNGQKVYSVQTGLNLSGATSQGGSCCRHWDQRLRGRRNLESAGSPNRDADHQGECGAI
jgi:hypothetical protein